MKQSPKRSPFILSLLTIGVIAMGATSQLIAIPNSQDFFHANVDSTDKIDAETAIENIRAFAKLYGYIKYFHPSDETSAIDWDKFAIYGVKEVKGAANRDELEAALDSLFLPIAPTLRIRQREIADSSFISFYLNHLDCDTTELQPVAWQHLGVCLLTYI